MKIEKRIHKRETIAFIHIFLFSCFFFFDFSFVRILVVDLSCNIQLVFFVYQVPFIFELKGNMETFMEPFSSVLITITMNLFNQLVIVVCDLVMED